MTSPAEKAWVCMVCGFVHRGENPPASCPVCGAASTDFEPYVEPQAGPEAKITQWRCRNCSYVHEGTSAPDACPVCGVAPDDFEPIEEVAVQGQADAALKVVVIGGGIAGVAAAESARQHAPQAMIHLLCSESRVPYYRLNLTRYLAGEIDQDALPIHPESWYAENAITLKTGSPVAEFSASGKSVTLQNGERLPYDSLVLAMGSHAFVPPIPGSDLDGVVTLRTADDADRILARAQETGHCVVIGGGILGIETAGALARQDVAVTLVESHAWLMPRQLNQKAAGLLESHIAGLGIVLRKQARTRSIAGDDKVAAVRFEDGDLVETALVVLATGVRSNTSLARKAGVVVNRGIVVDNHLQTSAADVYAAGDVAEHNGQLYGSWAPSQYQGSIAGLNAAGIVTEFGGVPRSNSLKILGIDLVSIGQFEPEDGSYLMLEHEADGRFAHFVFRDGKMAGSILMGYPELATRVKHAVERNEDFSDLLARPVSGSDVLSHLKG